MAQKKDKLFKVSRTHQKYFLADGTEVIGASTIVGLLNKPALVKWANNLGLQGIDSSKYVSESAKIGTLIHAMVEKHITGEELDLSEYSKDQIDLAENGFIKYLEWEAGHKVEPIFNEKQLVSEKFRYGGTLDFYAKVDGIYTLIDFKSGSGIYPEYFCQVSGYDNLLTENGFIQPERILILNIGRNETENFAVESIDRQTINTYFDIFKALVNIYWLKKKVNWR